MATNASNSSRTVHVHGAEVSTDQSQLGDYAEALAVLVVMFALLASIWIAAAPRPDADLELPAVIAPISGDFERAPTDTRVVLQPDPEGPSEIAVVRPDPAIGAPLAPETSPAPTTPT